MNYLGQQILLVTFFLVILCVACVGKEFNFEQYGDSVVIDLDVTEKVAKDFNLWLRMFRIDYGDKKLLKIYLDSRGGDVISAMKIGEAIRQDPLNIVVVPEDGVCLSSCVLIYAAGTQRLVAGQIGVHRPYLSSSIGSDRELIQKWYQSTKTKVEKYLEGMNVSGGLADVMFNTPPEYLKILNRREQNAYGLTARDPVFEEQAAAEFMAQNGYGKKEYLRRKAHAEENCNGDALCMDKILNPKKYQ